MINASYRFARALIGQELTPLDDVWMLVQDGIIQSIGTGRAPIEIPQHPAALALPGLVDCHVHLALSGSSDVEAEALVLDDEMASRIIGEHGAAHLRSGVTTVRDLGSPRDVVLRRAASGWSAASMPRLVVGSAVTSPSGHGHFLARAAETLGEYERAIADIARDGATFVKLFATGGVVTAGTNPGATQLDRDLLVQITERAHSAGLRVAAHAHGQAGIANAIEAHVDTIEHFSYLSQSDVAALTDSDNVLVSTLVATERFVESDRRAEATPEALAKILDHEPIERRALRRAVAAGVVIAVGTDAGTTFNPHGSGMQEQAHHLREAGMAPSEVLRSLTVRGAEAIGSDAGVLEVGRPADILALDADPVLDLSALYAVNDVILGGIPVSR